MTAHETNLNDNNGLDIDIHGKKIRGRKARRAERGLVQNPVGEAAASPASTAVAV